jgi:hypothetical protein
MDAVDGSEAIPAEGAMTRAVRDSIDALAPTEKVPKHRALALLALDYAAVIDANRGDPDVLLDFGPKLQSNLVALGCAPAKSAAVGQQPATAPTPVSGGEEDGGQRVYTLAERRELHRQRRAAGFHGA